MSAPAFASWRAIARPMFRPAPVTIATRPRSGALPVLVNPAASRIDAEERSAHYDMRRPRGAYWTERCPTMQDEGPKTVQAFDRALAILDAFTPERSALGVSEIARITGLSRSTVHRLLVTLRRHELVQQLPDSTNYALGPHLLRLAQIAFSSVNLQSIAKPIMERLRDRCDETVGLHARLNPTTRTVLDQVESSQPLRRTYTEIGHPIPIYQGAPGKVLLAYSSRELQDEVLAGKLEAVTPRTITDPERVRAELARIRKNGYALSFEERVPGVSTLAVPIANHTGAVVAAISVAGPSTRLSRRRLLGFVPFASEAARAISAKLGYAGEEGAAIPGVAPKSVQGEWPPRAGAV
ncbi:MAG: helix-turn-helix domain-containing protein [Actinobacteria bacterium]|nr:helix-turn-helix domain-containing protein [Actinomycetota bacterium]